MIEAYKKLDIQTRKLASSIFLGNYKAAFHGRGMEFRDFQQYSYGDDAKDIDWLVSARESKILTRRYQEERQLEILFCFDMSSSLDFGDGKTVFQLLQEVFFLLGFSAVSNGDKIGAFFLGEKKYSFIAPTGGQKSIFHIFQKLSIQSRTASSLCFSPVLQQKIQKKILFIISDRFDFDFRELKILSLQNDIIFFHLSDIFSDTLEGSGLISLSSHSIQYNISLDDNKKKSQYQELRKQKKKSFSQKLVGFGIETVFLNTKSNIFYEIFSFMKKRETHSL